MYFHVFIDYPRGKETTIYKRCDLREEEVKQSIAEPINEGRDFFFDCRRMSSSKIKGIGIFFSKISYDELILPDGKYAKDTENKFVYFVLLSKTLKGINNCTCQFIKKVNNPAEATTDHSPSFIDNKKVFIVHGTDYEPVKEIRTILQGIGITPIILHEQPSRGMTIIEKLEEYSDVGFAFILLTPDDLGVKRQVISEFYRAYLAKENPSKDEISYWLKSISRPIAQFILTRILPFIENRARQNVVLELGYFIGRLGRSKVCCLYKGDLELPSDIHGICYLHFNESVIEVKETIIEELKAANYEISS